MNRPQPNDPTDADLDAFLAVGDAELLDHVRAHTHPAATLSILLALPDAPLPHAPDRHRSTAKQDIQNRILAHALDRALHRALEHTLAFAQALDPNRDLERTRIYALARSHVLVFDLGRVRALARDLDLDLDFNLDLIRDHAHVRDLNRALARDLEPHLDRARSLARNLARDLDLDRALIHELMQAPVDASGVDLTDLLAERPMKGMKTEKEAVDAALEALDGVVWNEATQWPAELRDRVVTRSVEIGKGRYQVGDGTERDPHQTARM
ncbi:hypothetical protein [Actinomadura rubrisoli]|uniref:hypothetical protein n=1 Tax=Actinomadura rubrisoli TaxID=2530368 RepID=UPI001404DA89|nr:hypothetical protein [Actinomadura rubrisoli]